MAGIAKICKIHGKMQIGNVMWVWDYARDIPVKEKDMTKEQWKESEKVKWQQIKEQLETTTKEQQ